MISVIIPTVLKCPKVLLKLIGVLSSDSVVSEIIIIENSGKGLFLPPNDKIKIHNPEQNLYVNSSWNYGINVIKNEYFLIINDDILVCKNFCSKVLATGILEKENTGLVGINPNSINQYDSKIYSDIDFPISEVEDLILEPMQKYMFTGDWGSAYFGKKTNYYTIPEDLKIIYGDNYLLKNNIDAGKINYKISGLKFNHIHSASSASKEFSTIVGNDITNSKKYF